MEPRWVAVFSSYDLTSSLEGSEGRPFVVSGEKFGAGMEMQVIMLYRITVALSQCSSLSVSSDSGPIRGSPSAPAEPESQSGRLTA